MRTETLQWVSAMVFAVALLHTFAASFFERLAHHQPRHAGLWHLLGEVEIVFGFWAAVLIAVIFVGQGAPHATHYLAERNFTEPMFVFAIMVVAGSRAVLYAARRLVEAVSAFVPLTPGDWHALAEFLLIGSVIGSVFAALTFASAALSLPMIADREVDMITAVVSSINAVLRNKFTMALWAAIIATLTAIGFATAFVGLIVNMPWLAYASWHAYRQTLDPGAWPRLE